MAALDPATFDLPTLAALAAAAANEHLLRRLRSAGHDGIRTSHGYVIQLLVDEEPTVGELAERLGVSQQAASKSVVELEGLGVVERRVDARDSRVRRVALTAAGRDLLAAGRSERRRLEDAVAADVGDLAAAKRALLSLLEHAGGLDAAIARRATPPSA